MGAGKTTVGRRLAKRLSMTFLDSDHEIESRCGVDIPYIFEREGEPGFRERERKVIAELTQKQGIVLATGGGAILDAENRQALSDRGFVVYLAASVKQQLLRTGKSKNRPLLQVDNPQEKLQSLLDQRDPLYREIADLVITTDGQSSRQVAKVIGDKIKPLL